MNEDLLASRDRAVTLLEVYEPLLTPKMRGIMDDYYRYDLSLREIADAKEITRAAVFSTLKSALEKLDELESKLHLVERRSQLCGEIEKIEAQEDKDKILEGYRNLGKELIHGI